MTVTTRSATRLGAALITATAALAIAAPPAGASQASRPPRSGLHMHWFQSRSAPPAARFGSTAVIGLESMNDLQSLRTLYGFTSVRAISELHAAEVSVDHAQLHSLLASKDSRIRYVSPVGPVRRTQSMPNDPLVRDIDAWNNRPYEWAFAATHVDRALDISQGDPHIAVGVIDTGVADVPDLAGKIDQFWTFAPDGTPATETPADDTDHFGHGTAVSSVIAANVNDGFGMAGFGGASHVVVFRAGEGPGFTDKSMAIALMKLDSLGVRIVNMSIGGQVPNEPILTDAIHEAAADGVLIIASAGNDFSTHVSWPAADLQPAGGGRGFGLAVGATSVDGNRAAFSNSGSHLSLVAPGDYGGVCTGIVVALPKFSHLDEYCYPTFDVGGAHYGYISGTSFAAPEVAGVAALIWSARPELKNYQVAAIIKQSAHHPETGWTSTMGCGLLDAGAALELATSRAAEAWDDTTGDDPTCSATGDAPPAWPTEKNQAITFDPLPNKKFGDADFTVGARASSGLPVSFTANGNCIVNGATVHLSGLGSCTITAWQDGNQSYNLAPSIPRAFAITMPAAPGVQALPASGHPGARLRLPFRVIAATDSVSATIAVRRNGVTIFHLTRDLFPVESGRVQAVGWRASNAKGDYRFCVELSDGAGNKSGRSCASIRLR